MASRQQSLLNKMGLDGMIAVSPQNVTYTLQFKIPSHGAIPDRLAFTLVTKNKSYLIVANMEETTCKKYARVDEVIAYREFQESPTEKLAKLISDLAITRVGIEMRAINAWEYQALVKHLGSKVKFEDCTPAFYQMRTVKESWELEKLTHMAQLATNTHLQIKKLAKVGMREIDLWSEIVRLMMLGGAETPVIPCVGFGERSTFPNAPPTENRLNKGDMARIDLLFAMHGYCSDIARTYVAVTRTAEQEKLWNNLIDVHKRIIEAIKPGREAREVYAVFEQGFKKLGLPVSDFVGHGLGLELHEEPYIGRFHNAVLEPGMVMCIEPFVFAKGVHVEDTVLVTENGCKLLSSFKEFEELPIIGK